MGFRTAYGYTHSEAGWRMCNRDECIIPPMPDDILRKWMATAPVRAGAPATILGAWVIWYHRNVEPIISPIWGWSALNDVPTSNHLAGVALDLNAPKYPWGKRVMPADQIAKIRLGLKLFEGTVFWGSDWSRADEMHFQVAFREGDGRLEEFAAKLLDGHLGLYGKPKPKDPNEFPLPRQSGPWGPTWFFGPLDGPEQSISGQWGGDSPEVKAALGRWQAAAGVPVTTVWDEATKRAAQAVQLAKGWQADPNGFIYEGEWNAVVREGFKPDPSILGDPYLRPGVEYADVSQWQSLLTTAYPHKFVMFRVNNGDEVDKHAAANLATAKAMVDSGRLEAFGIYLFFRPGEDNVGTMRRIVGDNPHPRMVAMVDVEDAAGSTMGPVPPGQSDAANRAVKELQEWLGPQRVMGYLNNRANPNHWPDRPPRVPFVVPDYSAPKGKPRFPYDGWRVHQWTQTGRCAPWTTGVDLNYFPGNLREFLALFGMKPLAEANVEPVPAPIPTQQNGVPGVTTKIGAVTGPGTSAVQYGVGGTDLGIARRLPNGRQAIVLGDTFDAMGVGGAGWRSPLMLFTDEQDPAAYANGLTFHGAVGGNYARQLWPYNHDGHPWTNGGFSTVLPSDLLVIGSRIYLFVTVCRSLQEVLWTEIQYSDDNGQTWVHAGPAGQREWHHEGGYQMGITWELGTDGWVYIMGNKWLVDGGSNVMLYRCRPNEVADRSKWSGWGFNGTDWGWNRACTGIFPNGTKVREMNLRRVQGQWLLTYTQTAPDVRVNVKGLLNGPTSDIGASPTTTVVRHVAHEMEFLDRNNTLAQPYGGYVLEGSTLDELYVLVSQWDTRDNWPYQINLYRHTVSASIPRPTTPPVEPEPEPAPTLEEVVDENYLLSRAVLAKVAGDVSDLPTAPAAETFDVAADTNTALWRVAGVVDADTEGI